MNEQLIGALAGSKMFQTYEDAYTETTAMPLTLRPVEALHLPFQGRRKENAFCALMVGQSHTCGACLQLQEKLSQSAMNQPATKMCAYGLCETAVPLKLGPHTIGFLQTGQVMRQPPTGASFQRAVKQAARRGVNINNDPARRAYFNTPVLSQKKLAAATSLLSVFADQLAMKSNQIMMQTVNAEPQVITRAKHFIRENCTERLSLDRVSGIVRMNRYNFCKQFHKTTGLSFTRFVSLTRFEKATNLLLNPNLRVSEVAFAVGFQSLTHFNRLFKKFSGQSPTAYRRQLPAVAGGC